VLRAGCSELKNANCGADFSALIEQEENIGELEHSFRFTAVDSYFGGSKKISVAQMGAQNYCAAEAFHCG
jgi:hypothetical protein